MLVPSSAKIIKSCDTYKSFEEKVAHTEIFWCNIDEKVDHTAIKW